MSGIGGPNAQAIANAIAVNDRSGVVPFLLPRFLDTTGDGTGTKNANGDYSGALEEFKIVPGATEIFRLSRLIVHIADTGLTSPAIYGATGGALTNGITVKVRNASGDVLDLTDGIPIKGNSDYGRYCYDVSYNNFGAGNPAHIQARWSFFKSSTLLRIDGSAGEYFAVGLNDNLTGLTAHYFMVQGFEETSTT